MLSLAIFPVSILSLMNKEGTFLLWKKFTIAFFSLYFFAILISPTEGADYIKIEKGTVGIFLSCAYLAISLVLIAYKSYQLRGK